MRRGGRRRAPELGPVTAPPEEAAQGPGACLASPIVEGKGIAHGQLFTVKGSITEGQQEFTSLDHPALPPGEAEDKIHARPVAAAHGLLV